MRHTRVNTNLYSELAFKLRYVRKDHRFSDRETDFLTWPWVTCTNLVVLVYQVDGETSTSNSTASMSSRFRLNVIRIISNVKGKLTHPLFSVIELLPEVVEHIVTILDPVGRIILEELYEQIQLFKQNLDAAIEGQKRGTEYRHYCYYILCVCCFVTWVEG